MLDIPTDLASWTPADVTAWGARLADDPTVTDEEYLSGQRAVTVALLGEEAAALIHNVPERAALDRVRAELDRIAALPTVTREGRADSFATGARWTIRMIREVLDGTREPAQV